MGDGPGTETGAARAAGPGGVPSASTWFGLAVIGVFLFGLGVWTPAWRGVAGGAALQILCAAGGGCCFVLGAVYGARARAAGRRTPVEQWPGVEVYRGAPADGTGRSLPPEAPGAPKERP